MVTLTLTLILRRSGLSIEVNFITCHVTTVIDARGNNAYFVMAEVFASMKKVAYTVTVTLSTNHGFVTNATCQCKCVNIVFKHIHAASRYKIRRQFVPLIYCPL